MAPPDFLCSGLTVVFVGTSKSTTSAARGHYYSHRSNAFWSLLRATGLIAEDLTADDDVRVSDFGIGLTDLVARAESSDARLRAADFDAAAFVARVGASRPRVVAFNGTRAARVVARHLRKPPPSPTAAWRIGEAMVYALPSSSSSAAAIGAAAKQRAWARFGDWVRAQT